MAREKMPTGVVIGDALGIGPEITVKALADKRIYEACRPVLIGDLEIVKRAARKTRAGLRVVAASSPGEADFRFPRLPVIPVPFPGLSSLPLGRAAPASGEAFVAWFRKGYDLARSGEVGALVYAPLNKEAVHAAGFPYHDELDIIKDFEGGDPFLLVVSIAGRYRFASVPPLHVSLGEACAALSRESVSRSILLRPQPACGGVRPSRGRGGPGHRAGGRSGEGKGGRRPRPIPPGYGFCQS
jgi:4-hydroxythreonine-4-phosphate dehydrogenase